MVKKALLEFWRWWAQTTQRSLPFWRRFIGRRFAIEDYLRGV